MSVSLRLEPPERQTGKIIFCDLDGRKHEYDVESQSTTVHDKIYKTILKHNIEPQKEHGAKLSVMITGDGGLVNYNINHVHDIHNTELDGNIVMNYSLDASESYLVLDDCLLESNNGNSAKIIRGKFKKILIHNCTILNTDLVIICDEPPEVYIVDTFWSNSRLSLVDNSGNPLSTEKVITTSLDSDEEVELLRDYVRSEDVGLMDKKRNYGGLAVSLALLGALAVTAATNQKSEVEDVIKKGI